MWKRLLRGLASLAAATVLGLLLTEVGLRVYLNFAPCPESSPYVPDDLAGYRLRPSPAEVLEDDPDNYINRLGFRDRDHPFRKPPGTYRILGIGDSFVYGAVPPRQNFLSVCEQSLRAAALSGLEDPEVVLMGVGGYSPENEVGVLESVGLPLSPDLVVLCFFVGNDVHGIPIRGRLYRGRIYYQGSPQPVLHWLRQSRLFLLSEHVLLTRLRTAVIGRRHSKTLARSRPSDPDEARSGGVVVDALSTGQSGPAKVHQVETSQQPTPEYLHVQRKRIVMYDKSAQGEIEPLWLEAEGYLDRFDSLCRASGVPWVLVAIPAEIQVDPAVCGTVLRALGRDDSEFDFDGPQRRLRDYAAREEVPFLDLLPVMRSRHSPGERLYLLNDSHWNELGNRIAGEALSEFLKAHVLASRASSGEPTNAGWTSPE